MVPRGRGYAEGRCHEFTREGGVITREVMRGGRPCHEVGTAGGRREEGGRSCMREIMKRGGHQGDRRQQSAGEMWVAVAPANTP